MLSPVAMKIHSLPSLVSLSLNFELKSWADLLNVIHSKEGLESPGVLRYQRTRYPRDVKKKFFSGHDLDWFESRSRIGPFLPSARDNGYPGSTGRLGQTLEGASQRRIFAIGNYMNQRLLRPVGWRLC